MPVDVKYTAEATATGGRDGRASTTDGTFDVKLATPKELGGAGGEGNNPEQLFAAGYAACFIGALKAAGAQEKVKIPADTSITANVGIGPRSEGGFGLDVLCASRFRDGKGAGRGIWSRKPTISARIPMPPGAMSMSA